jgi:hypothetical protein
MSATKTRQVTTPKSRKPARNKKSTILKSMTRSVALNLDDEIEKLEAWFDEYDQVRADLVAKREAREAERDARRAEYLAAIADWK